MRRFYDENDASQEGLIRLWRECQVGPVSVAEASYIGRAAAIDGYRATVGRPGRRKHAQNVAQVGIREDVAQAGPDSVMLVDSVRVFLSRLPERIAHLVWLRLGLGWTLTSACVVVGVSRAAGSVWVRELTRLDQ